MRMIQMSPALAAQLRRRAEASAVSQAALPLHLEAPRHEVFAPAALFEHDAEDARVEAGGLTIGGDEDDDFY